MSVREDIIAEIHERLRNIPEVNVVFRNPKIPPRCEDYPAVSFFYREDRVIGASMTGDYPDLQREWPIIVVPYIIGSNEADEELAETELNPFVDKVRKALYDGGMTLSNKCSAIVEKSIGDLVKPYTGEPGIGVPITFVITYVDSIADLFTE